MDTNKIQIVQVPLNELTEIINNAVATHISKFIGELNQNNSPVPEKKLLSREEVGKLLGLSSVTLSKYHNNHTLRGVKIKGCRRVYYKKEDIYAKLNKDST